MKNKKFIPLLIAAILTITITGLTGCDSQSDNQAVDDQAADETINVENNQYWREINQKYRTDDSVNQLLFIRYTGGCSAKAFFYTKDKENNNAWILRFMEKNAYVGKYGIDKKEEGDAKTPTGEFGIKNAFGILPNPGTSLNYIHINENTFACDEDCDYYNTIIDVKEMGHKCKGEEMYMYSPEYNYGLEIDYNRECKYPDGSAIFIHCKGVKYFTGGCIAMEQKHVKKILKMADPGMKVVIGED